MGAVPRSHAHLRLLRLRERRAGKALPPLRCERCRRDVKPNNVMIGRDGSVRLLDFGLARGAGIDIATLTRTGTVLGTPGYMSPEQFDAHGVDERSDIYSLGVVLFEVLTGRLPFVGQTPIAVALAHKAEPPPLPRSLRPSVPAWLERVVLRCLEKDPVRRFATAGELAEELRRPREGASKQVRTLPGGDGVVLDRGETTDWALVLRAPAREDGLGRGDAQGSAHPLAGEARVT